MAGTEPTSVLPARASIVTSPLLVLGRPNRPATRNGTEVPFTGTGTVIELAKAPVAPRRKTTAPALAAEALVIRTLTVEPVAPAGLVIRMRHGEGAQVRKRAAGLALLLICSSTSMASPFSDSPFEPLGSVPTVPSPLHESGG